MYSLSVELYRNKWKKHYLQYLWIFIWHCLPSESCVFFSSFIMDSKVSLYFRKNNVWKVIFMWHGVHGKYHLSYYIYWNKKLWNAVLWLFYYGLSEELILFFFLVAWTLIPKEQAEYFWRLDILGLFLCEFRISTWTLILASAAVCKGCSKTTCSLLILSQSAEWRASFVAPEDLSAKKVRCPITKLLS